MLDHVYDHMITESTSKPCTAQHRSLIALLDELALGIISELDVWQNFLIFTPCGFLVITSTASLLQAPITSAFLQKNNKVSQLYKL